MKPSVCAVYKIINTVNGKCYIGSSKNINDRVARHKRELDNGIHNNTYLQNAWDKYGRSAFEFKTILRCSESEILAKEQQEIEKAWGEDGENLYNIAKNTLAPMAGIESPMKGRNHSKETCAKMSESHKGKPSPNKGNKLSEEVRARMSRDRRGKKVGWVNPNTTYDGELIVEIRNMYLTKQYTQAEISRMFGICRSHVRSIINNASWYDEEYEKVKLKEPVVKPISEETRAKISASSAGRKQSAGTLKKMSLYNANNKSVVQLDSGGRIIRTYRSACEAGRVVQVDNSAIGKACRGGYKTSGGYLWMYYEDYKKTVGVGVEGENGHIAIKRETP